MKCVKCNREMPNSNYGTEEAPVCPFCSNLSLKEASMSKYWETSKAVKPKGFVYPEDAELMNWDPKQKKWLDKDGKEKGKD